MVRIIFSRRSCRDGQFLSFNEERNQRRSKRKFPLLELPLLPQCLRSRSFASDKRQDTPLGAVASLRIGSLTLPRSTPQSAGGLRYRSRGKENVCFSFFKKLVKFFLDFFSLFSLIIFKKSFSLLFVFFREKVFSKGIFIYYKFIVWHHKFHGGMNKLETGWIFYHPRSLAGMLL